MKKKLAALLSALLLTLSLLPAQALAAGEPESADPPAVTETGEAGDQPSSRKVPGKPRPDPDPEKPGREDWNH